MRMHDFWAQNGLFAQMTIFSERLVNKPCYFHWRLSTCQNSKSGINLLVKYWRLFEEYWNLIDRELFLDITWEPDFFPGLQFSQSVNEPKELSFTPTPDKANDVIFLKSPKSLFLGYFCPMGIDIFLKNPAVTHNYTWTPNTMLSFRKN